MSVDWMCRRLGELLQGVALGLMLLAAIIKLLELANDVQIFRYQGF